MCGLILYVLLISSLIVTCEGTSSASIVVSSRGGIDYSNIDLVSFENNESFKWGIDGNGTGYMLHGAQYSGTVPFWSRGGIGAQTFPDLLLFEPETQIVHSGLQAANLSVVDTSSDGRRRLEILHDWNPHSEFIWQVGWYYFPSSLRPADGFVAFDRIIYERMWDQSKAVYFQQFQISLSLLTDGRTATKGQQIFVLSLGKGDIDNNNTGIGDNWPCLGADLYSNYDSNQNVPSSWITRQPGFQVPFDRWFKVVTLVFRNMTDFNNGFIKVWIDSNLVWDVQGTRTVGIAPSVLDSIKSTPPEPQGYLCSGFGLYTDIGTRPKTVFVDDIILSNSSQTWLAP